MTWLEPYARAGVGVTRHGASIGDTIRDVYETVAWSPHLAAGVGVDVVMSRDKLWRSREGAKPRFTFGCTFELGWRHTFGTDLEMARSEALDPKLEASDLNLGGLHLSGFTTRFAVVVRL